MNSVGLHRKNSKIFSEFLTNNKSKYFVEKTSSGFPTFNYEENSIYIRDKYISKNSLNKILNFQNQVGSSELYKFVNRMTKEQIRQETESINDSIMYKGFVINETVEQIENAIKIDLNTAYWQSCRIMSLIDKQLYTYVVQKTLKGNRLRLTGTLAKTNYVSFYDEGMKTNTQIKEYNKRRAIFKNIYERIRKFVDELMVYIYKKNTYNFIGFYVDCFWIKEEDPELINQISSIFKIKKEIVDLHIKRNKHRKIMLIERNVNNDELIPYDVQFKRNEFDNYLFLHNFDTDFKNINFKEQWNNEFQQKKHKKKQ